MLMNFEVTCWRMFWLDLEVTWWGCFVFGRKAAMWQLTPDQGWHQEEVHCGLWSPELEARNRLQLILVYGQTGLSCVGILQTYLNSLKWQGPHHD